MNRRPPLPRRRRLRQGLPRRRLSRERPALPPLAVPARAPDTSADPRADERLALAALSLENALLARELGRAQQRFSDWADASARASAALEAALLRERGANLVHVTRQQILREQLAGLRRQAAAAGSCAEAVPPPWASPPRVLCVGGRAHQLPVLQALVERRGGRFAHSAGDDAGIAALLPASDVVLLHAALLPAAAVRQVDAHCRRAGTPCVRLERLCARGFEQGLLEALARWTPTLGPDPASAPGDS